MNKAIHSENQKNICEIISKNPGIHLSKIAEMLDLKVIVVEQYLIELIQKNMIRCIESDGYRRYYLIEKKLSLRDKRIKQTKDIILNLISENPGLHLSKIAELLNMRLSLAEYHLQNLEKSNLILSVKDIGYYKRYYIEGSVEGSTERKIVSLLREEIPLKIVLFLLKRQNAKHKEILENFNITSSTLSYHLNKLVNLGIVDIPTLEKKGYSVRDNKEIMRLIKKYRLIPLSKSFSDVWDDLKFK